ncbi:hypothetical protein HMPREF0731_0405 [Pseudoroseomonas cervicalis ATCC 49957]|uniref:Uncharacterized protein n=1 Tax=Pseudoroseomonas cervicalis ATCC 49957 TaxID=525371 RepID=D5RH46_9PROT|nr:hypothetical protein HMPREF0731_0405 [Pseudoroseomonas cervicalis ATCC 49957]
MMAAPLRGGSEFRARPGAEAGRRGRPAPPFLVRSGGRRGP